MLDKSIMPNVPNLTTARLHKSLSSKMGREGLPGRMAIEISHRLEGKPGGYKRIRVIEFRNTYGAPDLRKEGQMWVSKGTLHVEHEGSERPYLTGLAKKRLLNSFNYLKPTPQPSETRYPQARVLSTCCHLSSRCTRGASLL